MLTSLSIQNVVLIDRLIIEFESGLCALTGETGAGKSILLDSLGLALGARSESGLVRKGSEQAQVIAVFQVNPCHPSLSILHNSELGGAQLNGADSVEIILRRSVSSDGRSKAYINDQPVSARLLRQVGDCLVEIHGQFETHGLLNPSTHRQMLDEYAGTGDKISSLFDDWKTKQEELEQLKAEAEKSRADEEYLRQAVEDLDALAPKAGEEEELSLLRERLMSREQVLEGLNLAYHALSGDEDPVRKAWSVLDRITGKLGEQGQKIVETLERASSEIEEASALIQAASADLQDSEHNLESIDDRLFELRGQARKHGCSVDGLPEKRDELAGQLNLIEHADEALATKIKEVEKARGSYIEEAKRVSDIRKKTAAKLDKLVMQELAPLKLEKAKFVTDVKELEEKEWGPNGMDRVQFLVATNPGSDPGPLNKIASGGEMARFMLALKVVMAETAAVSSMVFDEVDTGIGGSTADAVGERLARLAREGRQVMVVTHAPQVAARATHHYIVRKDGAKEVKTDIVHLSSRQERCEEIARMLAGATITQEARAAADKLLETGT